MTDNTRSWLHGLGAAAVQSLATAAGGAIALPTIFNLSHDGLINTAKLVFVPTALGVFLYLKQSPLPGVVLGPGDKLTAQNPVMGADGLLKADSAVLTKAPEAK